MNEQFEVAGIKFNIGGNEKTLEKAIQKAKQDRLVERIWARDHNLWKPQPDEISNRLGWLDVAERMRAEIPVIQDFVKSVKHDGMDRVLLLGMGGSSLAPELFSKLFGTKAGLKLSVLDSTDPSAVAEAEKANDPAQTLFIVSSKSGGTVETASFFKYFFNKAEETLGSNEAGKHFVAITDPGSGLEKTAKQHGFRQTFLADPNIGGRYSALSHFGLVPAALVGVDIVKILLHAEQMMALCKQPDIEKNPGVMLGLVLGSIASSGRDKATFLLPRDTLTFGDWVEQLIAESTGKQGKGILPVVREPSFSNENYGEDRVFISTQETDRDPKITLDWGEDYEVGAQFFLWEFATAVAGYVLGINPFDQPNVESAKVQARSLVEDYKKTGKLPKAESKAFSWSALENFVDQANPGDYIALQVYAAPNPELTDGIQQLRSKLTQRTTLATTFGYGPRFLHSTGQLHKGDRGNGLFIQIVSSNGSDAAIPNEAGKSESAISFGVLKAAQALGDAQALRAVGRRVIKFDASGNLAEAIGAIVSEAVIA